MICPVLEGSGLETFGGRGIIIKNHRLNSLKLLLVVGKYVRCSLLVAGVKDVHFCQEA